jgi:hydroxypyruvate reductase
MIHNTYSIQDKPWKEAVARVLTAALHAVEPSAAVSRYVQQKEGSLLINGQPYNVNDYQHIYVVGAGKAGFPMASSIAQILGERLTGGIVIVKEGYENRRDHQGQSGIELIEAGHPIPDERGARATRNIIQLLKKVSQDDLVICLISGGGSALTPALVDDITLDDLQTLTSLLLASGANIIEINTLRKHINRIKGGQLVRLAAPAKLVTLILSDVVGNPLEVIASGPTVPDRTTYRDAYAVLQRYDLHNQVPASVITHLQKGLRGEVPDTPKPGDPIFENVQNVIIGSNIQAVEEAIGQAGKEGFNTLLLTTYLEGEARQAGRFLAGIIRQVHHNGHPIPRPTCIVAGGETTVTLRGEGMGGRNQEVALGAVNDLAGIPDIAMITLATDGGDGPTDAAGAVITGETWERARELGLDPANYLARNDAYAFFDSLGDLLKTGPTNTNVNDLTFLFAFD